MVVVQGDSYSFGSGQDQTCPAMACKIGIVRVIGLFIALATVLQVKDTGKSRKG